MGKDNLHKSEKSLDENIADIKNGNKTPTIRYKEEITNNNSSLATSTLKVIEDDLLNAASSFENKSTAKKSITPKIWVHQEIPENIKTNFEPEKPDTSQKESREDQYLDDPADFFDNTPSRIRPNEIGKYKSLEDLKKLIDKDIPKKNKATQLIHTLGSIAGLGITLVPGVGTAFLVKKMKTVPQGKFQVVNKGGIYTSILLPGKHFLLNPFEKYEQMLDVDDERNNIRSVGSNIKIVQVKPNQVGVVRLVNSMKDENGKPLGSPGDALLLFQGNYKFREDEFYDFDVYDLNENQNNQDNRVNHSQIQENDLIKHGPLTIMTVRRNCLGCAYNIEKGEYEIFKPGKRRIFDKKEWSHFDLKERTKEDFKLGPWLFLTVNKGEIVSVPKKDGTYLVLSKPGTFKFHIDEWEHTGIERKHKDTSVEFNNFWIFSAPYNHYAEVEDKYGNYHTLESGEKYFLSKANFKTPVVKSRQDLIRDLYVELGSRWIISPTKNVLIGAWNVKKSEFEIFEDLKEAKDLPKEIYPTIEKIDKLSLKSQKFGPYLTINIPAGKKGIVAEEDGTLKIIEPGFHKLNGTSIIRESLPDKPIIMPIQLKSFYSKDLYELSGNFDIQFAIKNYEKLSNQLEIQNINFDQFKNDLNIFVQGKLSQLLRTFAHYQLTAVKAHEKENINENYNKLMDELSKELQEYSERSDLGIAFGKAKLASDIKLNDHKVRQNYYTMETSKLETEATKARAIADEQQSKARYEVEAKTIERTKEIEEKRILAETHKRELEQAAQIEIAKRERQAQIEKQRQELEAKEERTKISVKSELERQKESETVTMEIQDKELTRKRKALEYQEQEQIKLAEIKKQQQILEAQANFEQRQLEAKAEAEKEKIQKVTQAETEETIAKKQANAMVTKAEARKKDADANAYKTRVEAEAEAEKVEKLNNAKSKMPEQEVRIELARLKAEEVKGAFANGIFFDHYQKFATNYFEEIIGKSQVGKFGPPVKEMLDVVKDSIPEEQSIKSESSDNNKKDNKNKP